jgi:hypothetical protein
MNRYKCTLNTISIYYAKPYSARNTYAKINPLRSMEVVTSTRYQRRAYV